MSIYDEMKNLGYEFDHEYGNSDAIARRLRRKAAAVVSK